MNQAHKKMCSWLGCCCGNKNSGLFWGIMLLLVGLFFIAQELGWITVSFPFWGVVFTAFGIYMIIKNAPSSGK